MKTLFIPAIRKLNHVLDLTEINHIPGKLHILYSIQYKALANTIRQKLGKKVVKIEQVLGCSKIKPKATLLLIGSGRFHAVNLAISSGKPVYIYDSGKLEIIKQEEIDRFKRIEQGKLSKFYASDNIGLLVSTKPGQNKLKQAELVIKQLRQKYKEKKFYLFLTDNINLGEIENFPIDMFLNFACPGLELDSHRILNYEKVMKN